MTTYLNQLALDAGMTQEQILCSAMTICAGKISDLFEENHDVNEIEFQVHIHDFCVVLKSDRKSYIRKS